MDKIATENLFLLEFLVDKVDLDPKCDCDAPGETCVSFQFLDNAPLDVCEEDFSPKRSYNKNEKDSIKSGKSCLFSLSPEQAAGAIEQFDIFVAIFKKMQPGWLPEKVEVGAALISIANLFGDLINCVETSDGTSPLAKTLKDSFDITNEGGRVLGKIGVYIRMSCFGKLIVTQFQMNLDDKSVLFKDKEGKSLYRYKKAGKDKGKTGSSGGRTSCSSPQDGGGYTGFAGGGFNSGCPIVPCDTSGGGQYGGGGMPGGGGYNTGCPTVPCDSRGGGGANYNGSFGGMPSLGNPNCPFAPCGGGGISGSMAGGGGGFGGGGFGGAGFGGGSGFGGGGFGGNEVPCSECGGKMDAMCLSRGGGGMMGGMGMGGGGAMAPCVECGSMPNAPCLPPGGGGGQGKENVPFAFKMGGNGGDGGVTVNPPACTAPDGSQYTEFSDPNKEVFILRIGKKSEGAEKKQNLELELCTPKGKDLKPIPKKETRESQYDPQDAGEDKKCTKKEKGGGKEGKKKGK